MKSILISIVACCIATFAFSQTKVYSKSPDSYIIYSANHPMHAWEGKSTSMKSIIVVNDSKNILKAAVSVPVSSFNSGNSNRDSHMIEVTEALEFPMITFVSSKVVEEGDSLILDGKINFHGIDKTIATKASMKRTGNEIVIDGTFNVKISDFNIENPSLMGIETDDNLGINFHIIF